MATIATVTVMANSETSLRTEISTPAPKERETDK
jgi:hypothetical protein